MSEVENIIKIGESQDLGIAIQSLISDNIKEINTCFLGKIHAINGNRLDVMPLLKKQGESDLIISNVLIAQPFSGDWFIHYELKAGDIGIVLISQNDISSYKKSGQGGIVNTNRYFDITDSFFLPLSLFNHKEAQGLIISSADSSVSIELNSGGAISIKAKNAKIEAQEFELKSENPLTIGTSKSLIDCFDVILDNLENGIKGGITSGSPASQTITALPALAPLIQQMKATIKEVLK